MTYEKILINQDKTDAGGLVIASYNRLIDLETIQSDGYILRLVEASCPKEIVKAFLEGITFCSTYMEKEELLELLKEWEKEL